MFKMEKSVNQHYKHIFYEYGEEIAKRIESNCLQGVEIGWSCMGCKEPCNIVGLLDFCICTTLIQIKIKLKERLTVFLIPPPR